MAPALLLCRGLVFWLPPLVVGALGSLVLHEPWASGLILLGGLLLWLFRAPSRSAPPIALGVLSPADGRVTGIDSVYDPCRAGESTRVSIRMSPFGPYTTRGPAEGTVLQSVRLETLAGAISEGARARGAAGWIETDEGERIGMVFHRRNRLLGPVCVLHVGERVGQGQVCGCIPLGGRVDVLLPGDVRLEVSVGDRVLGGVDSLARLSRRHAH